MLVNVCPDGIFWTTAHFVAKFGMAMQPHEPECHAEQLVYCLQCQGHSEGIYNQNDMIVQHHNPECPVEKNGLLHSRLRPQRRFKMSVNVCPDDIFWTVEHFVTKLGMVMQHHEPECHAGKRMFSIFKVKVTARAHNYNQNMALSTISSELLISWQPNSVRWYIIISQSVLWQKLDCCVQGKGHSEGLKCKCLSRWYLLNLQIFCYQTWYCDASTWAGVSCKKIGLLFSRSRSQQGLLWSKFESLYDIF